VLGREELAQEELEQEQLGLAVQAAARLGVMPVEAQAPEQAVRKIRAALA
jgi:hypothetical protein